VPATNLVVFPESGFQFAREVHELFEVSLWAHISTNDGNPVSYHRTLGSGRCVDSALRQRSHRRYAHKEPSSAQVMSLPKRFGSAGRFLRTVKSQRSRSTGNVTRLCRNYELACGRIRLAQPPFQALYVTLCNLKQQEKYSATGVWRQIAGSAPRLQDLFSGDAISQLNPTLDITLRVLVEQAHWLHRVEEQGMGVTFDQQIVLAEDALAAPEIFALRGVTRFPCRQWLVGRARTRGGAGH
jgi:hypothetical protein